MRKIIKQIAMMNNFLFVCLFASILFCDISFAGSVSVSKTNISQGELLLITWSGFACPSGPECCVNIELWQGSNKKGDIYTREPNSGSKSLNSSGWIPGSNYRIRILDRSNINNFAFSQNFTVNTPVLISAPNLINPASGGNLEGAPYTFTWGAVSGAGAYHIKISTRSDFTTTVVNDDNISGSATTYTYSGSLAWGTTHYWQMRTLNSSGITWGNWSAVKTFVPSQKALSAPNLINPASGGNLEGAPYTFTWGAVSGAGAYHIKISTRSDFTTTVVNDDNISGSVTSYTYSGSLTWGTTHYWQMRTLNSSGATWGNWSTVRTFVPTQKQLNAPNLINPSQNATITTQDVTFSWSNVGAQRYELYVDNNLGFGSPEISKYSIQGFQNYTGTSYNLEGIWLPQNPYYWKVIDFFSDGTQQE